MKSLQLRLSTLAVFLFCLYSAQAERFWIDGFEYEFNDHDATVTGCSLGGDIIIPETVTNNNVTYTVTTIGGLAFYCDHKVTSIVLLIWVVKSPKLWPCICPQKSKSN